MIEQSFLYESNPLYFHIFRNFFLYISLLFFSLSLAGYLYPGLIPVNNRDMSIYEVGFFLILSIFCFFIYFKFKDRFARVKVNNLHFLDLPAFNLGPGYGLA